LEHPEEVICIRHRLHIRVWLKDASAGVSVQTLHYISGK
jgi:hypothetical protein